MGSRASAGWPAERDWGRWVQVAPIGVMIGGVPKVMQIRDVPDEVHDALTQAAQAQGLSLTKYVLRELEHLAIQPQVVRDNAASIRRTQRKVQGRAGREMILAVLHEGRGE